MSTTEYSSDFKQSVCILLRTVYCEGTKQIQPLIIKLQRLQNLFCKKEFHRLNMKLNLK